MKISKTFRFEASHQISNHPGKCSRLHGHSWQLTVSCEGCVDPSTGMVIDYFNIKQAVQPLIDLLDHTHLGSGWNKVITSYSGWTLVAVDEPINCWLGPQFAPQDLPDLPTSENLLFWMADWLTKTVPTFSWSQLRLNETCTSEAELQFTDYWLLRRKERRAHENSKAQDSKDQEASARGIENEKDRQDLIAEAKITDDDIPF